jgi:hypothetical protein
MRLNGLKAQDAIIPCGGLAKHISIPKHFISHNLSSYEFLHITIEFFSKCCVILITHHTRFIGLAYQGKKDIVFRFIIEYSSLRDFGP